MYLSLESKCLQISRKQEEKLLRKSKFPENGCNYLSNYYNQQTSDLTLSLNKLPEKSPKPCAVKLVKSPIIKNVKMRSSSSG